MKTNKNKKKERVFVIIDGSNFYHRLKEDPLKLDNLLNFDFNRFVQFLLRDRILYTVIYYVGAIRTEKNNAKSYKLFKNQAKLFGILEKCNIKIWRGYILKNGGYHEKGVDVQMAVDLLIGAYEDLWETVIILSSDTDLIPAIQKIKQLKKTVEYVGFSHKPSLAMIANASNSKLLSEVELKKFL